MSKEEVLQGYLSKDAHRVLKASHEVIHSVIKDRDMIESLVPYLEKIQEATQNLSYGGTVLPNQRFVDKALKIIWDSKENQCLCEYAFDGFGQCAKFMEKYGFVLLEEKTEGYVNTGKIECPKCHQRYIVEEEFTGWHVTSTRYRRV